MSTTFIASVQWGGTIIRNEFGFDYQDGQCVMFEFGNISRFDDLRATIERELNITENQYISSLMYRQPVQAAGHSMYKIVKVHNDAAIKIIKQIALQCGSMGVVEFYATVDEYEPINDANGDDSNVGEDDVDVDNNDIDDDSDGDYDDDDDDDDDDGEEDEEEDDDLWLEIGEHDEEDDGCEDMDAYYNTHCSNPIFPLVYPPPHSEIDYDIMQVDTRTKPGRILFDPLTEFHVGMLFPSRDAVQLAAKEYSLRKNHHFRCVEAKETKYIIECANPIEQCHWRLRAFKKPGELFWKITKYNGPHTCRNLQMSSDHRQLDQKYICGQIEAMVAAQPDIKIKPLMAEIKDKLGFEPTYRKTWAAKQMAIAKIFGGWDDSYGQLRKYMNKMKSANPGFHFVIDDCISQDYSSKIFNRMFWTFMQTSKGFQSCRPVIFVDGTFLFGKYRGILLCASSFDGNNNIFMLAFAVVDRENVANWTWFMDLLRTHVVNGRENICVISDRHIGILKAMETEEWRPPHGHHRYCIRHVVSNYNKQFKNAEGKKFVQAAAYENQERKFVNIMNRMTVLHPETAKWCEQIPKEKWTKAYDEGRRYGAMTTNVVESVNGMLKNFRGLPITAMVDKIFYQLTHYFDTRRTTYRAQQVEGREYTHFAGIMLEENIQTTNRHDVTRFDSDAGIFEVKIGLNRSRGTGGNKHKVHLDRRTCTCGKFQELKIPCSHVLAACQKYGIDYHMFVDEFYRLDRTLLCYEYMFYPMGHPDYWLEPDDLPLVPDPNRIRKKGRPRTSRIRNEMDWSTSSRTTPSSSTSRNACSICGKSGHNKKTCAVRSGPR